MTTLTWSPSFLARSPSSSSRRWTSSVDAEVSLSAWSGGTDELTWFHPTQSACANFFFFLVFSGVVRTLWAVELDPSAAATFKRNSPHTTVLNQDCNALLARAMRRHQNKVWMLRCNHCNPFLFCLCTVYLPFYLQYFHASLVMS